MAAWQFDVTAVFEHGGQTLPPLLCRRAKNLLAESFPTPWQMMPGWAVYGEESGNRVDLLTEADGTCELSARIDTRSDTEPFLTCWLVLMLEMNCSLYSPELDRSFPADMLSLKDALRSSSAWSFAQPAG